MGLAGGGRAEDHQHAVAQKLDQGSAAALDLLVHLTEEMVEHGDQILRLHPLAQRRKAAQIAHQDRELPLLPAQLPTAGGVQDLPHDIVGQIAAEGLLQDAVAHLQLVVQRLDSIHGLHRIPHLRQLRDVADDEDHAGHFLLLTQAGGDDTQLFFASSGAVGHIALHPSSLFVDGVQNALDKGVVLLLPKKGADKGTADQFFLRLFQDGKRRIIGKLDPAVKADGHNALRHVRNDAVANQGLPFHAPVSPFKFGSRPSRDGSRLLFRVSAALRSG